MMNNTRTVLCRGAFWILFLMGSVQLVRSTPWTPLEWQDQGKLKEWIRDIDKNGIDDLIDRLIPSRASDEKINITVDFNRCVSETVGSEVLDFLKGIGNIAYVGKIVTFAVVTDVKLSDIPAIATLPEVAMVELYTPVIPALDMSTRAIKVRAGSFPPGSTFTYSPETVEDLDPLLTGSGINMVIIDSGVDNDHPSFRGSYVTGCDFTDPTSPAVCSPVDPEDESGHGTAVATVALGRGAADGTFQGVAPDAGLIDLKVFRGEDNISPYGAIEAAIEWVILNQDRYSIQVANLSFSDCYNSDGRTALDQLVNAMAARNIVVVTAAGNRKVDECGDPPSGEVNRIGAGSAASLGITVANSTLGPVVGETSMSNVNRINDEIYVHSLRGPRIDGRHKPELAAPGTFIVWDMDRPFETSEGGTSLSAPHVAGIAGLIRQRIPEINPESLKDLLIRTAHRPDSADSDPDVHNPTWTPDWGYGLVDAYQAFWQVTGQGEAQTDLTFEDFEGLEPHPPDPIWLSPAIRFNYGTENEDVLLIGEPNEISVNVLNRDREANNVQVTIGIYYFMASDPDRPQFYEIAFLEEDFPVGTKAVSYTWTPSEDMDIFSEPDAHICIRVSIDYGLDRDYSNYSNVAQRNLRRVETSSPALFRFRVENPLAEPAFIHLDVRGDEKNPPGWEIQLSDNDFEMDPSDCARNVELSVNPPEGVSPGTEVLYHVYASAMTEVNTIIPLGGLSVQAFVPDRQRLPWIWLLVILAAAIVIYLFIKRYKRKRI